MGFYLDNAGNYYEGDRADIGHRAVPQRPSDKHKFTDGEWLLDETLVSAETTEKAKAELADIDLKSIRSIREWLVTQPTAPQFIKDYEAQAKVARAKIQTVKEK